MKKKIFFLIFFIGIFLGGGLFLFFKEKKVSLESPSLQEEKTDEVKKEIFKKSPFSGLPCRNSKMRSFAPVFHQDPKTMPLWAIEEAEIVIEAPYANPGGVTRLLAIYQCQLPEKIGPLRSLRPFMIDLGLSFDSILASWGASSEVPAKIRNLNADWFTPILRPLGKSAFFRSSGTAPYNAFLNGKKLINEAGRLKMRLENQFEGYQFKTENLNEISQEAIEIKINYHYPVEWIFKREKNAYLRFWNGKEIIDAKTKNPILAKNIILLKTKIETLKPGVAKIKTQGEGEAKIYQQGKEINAIWKKENPNSKIYFFDENGKQIEFLPGKIWIEIVDKFPAK